MRNNSTRLKGKKKTSTSQYQSFEHNGMEICDQQRLESLEEKKGGAHFMQAWHQKNLQTLIIPKDDQPANSGDMNTLETIWIIVDETTYKDSAPKTLDELRQRFASPAKM